MPPVSTSGARAGRRATRAGGAASRRTVGPDLGWRDEHRAGAGPADRAAGPAAGGPARRLAGPHPAPAPGPAWIGWLVTLLVGAVAGGLRLWHLSQPGGRIFDEVYYACDAQNLLRFGVEMATQSNTDADQTIAAQCIPTGAAGFIVHPPLGKWLIALGLKAFGTNELGWRVAAAVAGTLTVVVVVRTARRMTGSTLLGAVAGGLLALDGLHFVQSRVAMLDVFLVLFTTAAFACLVADRDPVRRRLARTPDDDLAGRGPRLGLRPWRLAAGVMLGAALATKWSGVYSVAAVVLLAFAWEVGARRTAGARAPVRSTLLRSALPTVGALLLLPAALYTLSWAGWFLTDTGYDRNWADSNPSAAFGSCPTRCAPGCSTTARSTASTAT